MSSVKKIIALAVVALLGCSTMTGCKQKEEPVSMTPAGQIFAADEAGAPADGTMTGERTPLGNEEEGTFVQPEDKIDDPAAVDTGVAVQPNQDEQNPADPDTNPVDQGQPGQQQ